MAKFTWMGWQTDISDAAQPTTGIVIPFRPRKVEKEPWTYYSDLDEVMKIIDGLSYPAITMLLTGVLLNVLHTKNGRDAKASLADVREFVRGLRFEIRGQSR